MSVYALVVGAGIGIITDYRRINADSARADIIRAEIAIVANHRVVKALRVQAPVCSAGIAIIEGTRWIIAADSALADVAGA